MTEEKNVEMTPSEQTFIDAFVKEHCTSHELVIARRLDAWCERMQLAILSEPVEWRLASAGGILPPLHAETRPESPDETVRFVFASDSERPGKAWRAELTVPPRATVGTLLPLHVSGLGIDAVPQGVFLLAGCKIPLADGKGGILFDIFLSGIRNSDVSLIRPDGSSERGKLMFL